MINLLCKKCEFTTNRKDKLKTHIESKHYQNKIKCPESSVEFSRKDSMEKNKKIYDPIDPLAVVDVENHSTPSVTPTVVTSTPPMTPTVAPNPTVAPTPAVVAPTPEQALDTEVSAFDKRLVQKMVHKRTKR